MKALVTGAAGFVGSNLVRQLTRDGHDVVGVDSLTDYYDIAIKLQNLKSIASSNFEFVKGDLNDLDLKPLVDGTDYIFHQAGQPGVRKSWGTDFLTYTECNISATQRLLEASRGITSLKKFVYASSSSIYGNAESYPTQETALPQPISPYGVSKLAAEHLAGLYASNFGVPTVSLRYFTVYGPGQRPDMAFTRFVRAAILGEEIRIFGSGSQIRDFTYVEDIVSANIKAAMCVSDAGAVFNVAGGSNISVNEVLDVVQGIHGGKLNIRYVDPVAGDVFRTRGSIEAFTTATQWEPTVDIESGLRLQYAWALEAFSNK